MTKLLSISGISGTPKDSVRLYIYEMGKGKDTVLFCMGVRPDTVNKFNN